MLDRKEEVERIEKLSQNLIVPMQNEYSSSYMTADELAFERQFVNKIFDSESCLLKKNKLKKLIEDDFPLKK